jgi:carbonic anhydrase/acetyltransferase-like protein (isoleucine patch superfamily)
MRRRSFRSPAGEARKGRCGGRGIVGAPAKLIRAADDQTRAMIARGADVYVKRWKRYAAGLKRIG